MCLTIGMLKSFPSVANIYIPHFRLFGQKKRMLPLWPTISNSPILTLWDWSPLIHSAYSRNRHLFERFPSSRLTSLIDTLNLPGPEDPRPVIKGLLAIHLRRGDFEEHCRTLAVWGADWHAWNSFPEFIDQFEKPRDTSEEETTNVYLDHCYPSIQQIVDKVKRVRQDSRPTHDLKYLYIMTNGATTWVEELKTALAEGVAWESIKSSRDLDLTWEEKFVAHAMDMFVAQRAEMIIGNGVSSFLCFSHCDVPPRVVLWADSVASVEGPTLLTRPLIQWSSLTSNVVMLRMAHGFPTDSNRFW